jgi:hypothetical protein
MREGRGEDPRPACSAGRTGGPLHAVLVTHPPRLLMHEPPAVSVHVDDDFETTAADDLRELWPLERALLQSPV